MSDTEKKKTETFKVSTYCRYMHAPDSEESREVYFEDWRFQHNSIFYSRQDLLEDWEEMKEIAEGMPDEDEITNGRVVCIWKEIYEMGTLYSYKYI